MDVYQLFRLLLMVRLAYDAARLRGITLLLGGVSAAGRSSRSSSQRR